MLISELELKEFLEYTIKKHQNKLKEYHQDRLSQDSYAVGYSCGARDVCMDIICAIKEGH